MHGSFSHFIVIIILLSVENFSSVLKSNKKSHQCCFRQYLHFILSSLLPVFLKQFVPTVSLVSVCLLSICFSLVLFFSLSFSHYFKRNTNVNESVLYRWKKIYSYYFLFCSIIGKKLRRILFPLSHRDPRRNLKRTDVNIREFYLKIFLQY